jgi:putative membrane protein
MDILALILGVVVGILFYGLVIWIVGKLRLGLEVSGFGSAITAAIAIAVVGGLINWLLGSLGVTLDGGLLGAIINLVLSAIVLMIAGRIEEGLVVKGFAGALVAAIAIGIVTWLINWVFGLLF